MMYITLITLAIPFVNRRGAPIFFLQLMVNGCNGYRGPVVHLRAVVGPLLVHVSVTNLYMEETNVLVLAPTSPPVIYTSVQVKVAKWLTVTSLLITSSMLV